MRISYEYHKVREIYQGGVFNTFAMATSLITEQLLYSNRTHTEFDYSVIVCTAF